MCCKASSRRPREWYFISLHGRRPWNCAGTIESFVLRSRVLAVRAPFFRSFIVCWLPYAILPSSIRKRARLLPSLLASKCSLVSTEGGRFPSRLFGKKVCGFFPFRLSSFVLQNLCGARPPTLHVLRSVVCTTKMPFCSCQSGDHSADCPDYCLFFRFSASVVSRILLQTKFIAKATYPSLRWMDRTRSCTVRTSACWLSSFLTTRRSTTTWNPSCSTWWRHGMKTSHRFITLLAISPRRSTRVKATISHVSSHCRPTWTKDMAALWLTSVSLCCEA